MSHVATIVYGICVPEDQWGIQTAQASELARVNALIKSETSLDSTIYQLAAVPSLDDETLYLIATHRTERISVYHVGAVSIPDVDRERRSDRLKMLAAAAGYEGLAEPAWLVIPTGN